MESSARTQQSQRKPRNPRKITRDYLHNAGLYYLQRFAASRARFEQVMTRKIKKSCAFHAGQDFEACLALLKQVTDRFVEVGLLNDDLYTQGLVRSLRRSGKSRTFVIGKLREKGIDPDFALPYLEAEDDARDDKSEPAELQAARIYARKKKLGPYAGPSRVNSDPQKIYQRHLGALARAGYSYDVAKKVLETE